MAPLTFGDKIGLYSMIGTWLGTVFTLIGLVALITQLRSLLKDFSNSRHEIVKAAAGDWAVCLPRLRRSDTGILENKLPSLQAWIRHHYEEGSSVVVYPFDRKPGSGQSSWSQLFGRLQILPKDLLNPGSRISRDERPPTRPEARATADLLVEGSKVYYGLPSNDFAALCILGGFSPSLFDPNQTTLTVSHLGSMYLAAHSDPFSQIAQMDGTFWNTSSTSIGMHWEGRYADRLNVRHCLDLALGILRFDFAGKPTTFIFCSGDRDKATSQAQSPWSKPSPRQVLNIRRNLVSLTGGSLEQNVIYDITWRECPDFRQFFGYGPEIGQGIRLDASEMNTVFEIALGLTALKPWGMLPVIPQSIVNAFCPYLDEVLANTSKTLLAEKFRELPTTVRYSVPHRTRAGMDLTLDTLADIKTRNFSGLSPRCSLYYDAMIYIFENHNLKLEDVEIALAAYCATNFAFSKMFCHIQTEDHVKIESWQWERKFRAFVRQCLKGSPRNEIESWACEILASYLHAWLQEARDLKEDFRGSFRRRVFLG